jgi:hypothetical protein
MPLHSAKSDAVYQSPRKAATNSTLLDTSI